MKQKFYLLILITLCCLRAVQAQVNLQTGAAQVSIPLYSYSDANNRIGTGISLDYIDGNGLKVNEMASCVGTGWNLNVGGAITRIQHGEPDDQKSNNILYGRYLDEGDYWRDADYVHFYYPDGYLFTEYDPRETVTNGGGYSKINKEGFVRVAFRPQPQFLADREQDEFAFSFNGRNGKFVIGKDALRPDGTVNTDKIITIVDSKLKIDFEMEDQSGQGIRTRISQFSITDENGIKYIFRDKEYGDVVTYDDIRNIDGNQAYRRYSDYEKDHTIYTGKRVKHLVENNNERVEKNARVINKWHLSEIINPLTQSKITFHYEDYDVDMNTERFFQKSVMDGKTKYTLTWAKMLGQAKRIKSINYSALEKMEFVYSQQFRKDIPFEKSLSDIRIYYNGIVKSSWNFSYDYSYKGKVGNIPDFVGNETLVNYSRLYLTELKRKGLQGKEEPPYKFKYKEGDDKINIPPMFSYYHDHWGYANRTEFYDELRYYYMNSELKVHYGSIIGFTNYKEAFQGNFRQVADKRAQIGIIETVSNPTGGSLSFEYEQNTCNYENVSLVPVGGVHVSKTTLFDGVDHTKDVVTTYRYVKEDGLSSGWGFESLVYSKSSGLTLRKAKDYTQISEQAAGVISQSVLQGFATEIAKGAGVTTSGLMASMVGSFAIGYAAQIIIEEIISIFSDKYKDFTTDEYYSEPINANCVLPIQYSRVEVSSMGAGNGKTVYEFTSKDDYPLYKPIAGSLYSDAPRLANWQYGMPKKVWVFDKYNKPLKMTEYIYNPLSRSLSGDRNFISQKWASTHRWYDIYDYPQQPFNVDVPITNNDEKQEYLEGIFAAQEYFNKTDKVAHEFYAPLVGRMELEETKEYTYNVNKESTVSSTTYSYSPYNYQVNTITSNNSKNETIETWTRYSSEYSLSSIKNLLDNHILNAPVSTESYLVQNGNRYQLGGNVVEYGTVSNGDVKPVRTYSFQSAVPVDRSGQEFAPDQLLPYGNYYKESQSLTYNAYGLPVQAETKNGQASKLSSIVYDYDNKLVIAKALNASFNEIAYTSFEAEGTGNWSFPVSNAGFDRTVTGIKNYKMDNMPITSSTLLSLSTSRTYIVSYWSKKEAMNVSGTLAGWPKPLRTIKIGANTWTYFEHKVSGVTSVTISGKGFIDELRLYPEDARMATTVYDRYLRKTAEGDENNRITHYRYDDLDRLMVVMDETGNIVRRYCYNYKNQQESCEVQLVDKEVAEGNDEKTVYFQKDCEYGIGTWEPYTVPADTYFAADRSAANELALKEIKEKGQSKADQIGVCNGNEKRTYARLEIFPTPATDYYNACNCSQVVTAYIRFYSDEACTIQVDAPADFTYRIHASGYMEYSENGLLTNIVFGSTDIENSVISLGSNELLIDNALSFDGDWRVYDENGSCIYEERWKDDYELTSIEGWNFRIAPTYVQATHAF